ncbi:HDOD domain-containing protein [Niveibacterium sp. SC-1]|uniref:HDOD domain-containing protein n=1 Tax=Niveibacterium sp. SC-1 TaxID=3135646 RepID=UPI00311D5FC2
MRPNQTAVRPAAPGSGLLINADDSPESLLARGIKLPPQPRALQQIQMLAEAGGATARQVAAVVATDPGLTAALYRVARSPLYARRVAPQTVEQVVVLLGVNATLTYAQAECLQSVSAGDPRVLERFWARSRAIAQLTELIAGNLPGRLPFTPSEAYLTGMFHDCGVPVLMQRFPDYCRSVGLQGQMQRWVEIADEDRHFACDHAVLGLLLARHWRLPDRVAQAIHHHHEAASQAEISVLMLVRTLQIAMAIYAEDLGLHEKGMPTNGLAAADLQVSEDELGELIDYVREQFLEHVN